MRPLLLSFKHVFGSTGFLRSLLHYQIPLEAEKYMSQSRCIFIQLKLCISERDRWICESYSLHGA